MSNEVVFDINKSEQEIPELEKGDIVVIEFDILGVQNFILHRRDNQYSLISFEDGLYAFPFTPLDELMEDLKDNHHRKLLKVIRNAKITISEGDILYDKS